MPQARPPERLEHLLSLVDVPEPVAADGEIVVAVTAAAVNFTDVLFIGDGYQVSVDPPFTPGSEFAGVVTDVGPGVSTVEKGALVRGAMMVGAFAERVLVPASAVTRLPETAGLELAAATGVTHSTAYSALRSAARIAHGEWVAITGASGGVGSAALTLARESGARTLAVVSTPAKAAFCHRLGADAIVDLSSAPDVKGRIREITGGGADVVLDVVGGDLAETMLRAMRRRGRFVTLGYASGDIPRIPLSLVLLKGVQILGFDIRRFTQHEPELAARDAAELAALYERGVGATVTARYPLERAAAALTAVASRSVMGKVVLVPGGTG